MPLIGVKNVVLVRAHSFPLRVLGAKKNPESHAPHSLSITRALLEAMSYNVQAQIAAQDLQDVFEY